MGWLWGDPIDESTNLQDVSLHNEIAQALLERNNAVRGVGYALGPPPYPVPIPTWPADAGTGNALSAIIPNTNVQSYVWWRNKQEWFIGQITNESEEEGVWFKPGDDPEGYEGSMSGSSEDYFLRDPDFFWRKIGTLMEAAGYASCIDPISGMQVMNGFIRKKYRTVNNLAVGKDTDGNHAEIGHRAIFYDLSTGYFPYLGPLPPGWYTEVAKYVNDTVKWQPYSGSEIDGDGNPYLGQRYADQVWYRDRMVARTIHSATQLFDNQGYPAVVGNKAFFQNPLGGGSARAAVFHVVEWNGTAWIRSKLEDGHPDVLESSFGVPRTITTTEDTVDQQGNPAAEGQYAEMGGEIYVYADRTLIDGEWSNPGWIEVHDYAAIYEPWAEEDYNTDDKFADRLMTGSTCRYGVHEPGDIIGYWLLKQVVDLLQALGNRTHRITQVGWDSANAGGVGNNFYSRAEAIAESDATYALGMAATGITVATFVNRFITSEYDVGVGDWVDVEKYSAKAVKNTATYRFYVSGHIPSSTDIYLRFDKPPEGAEDEQVFDDQGESIAIGAAAGKLHLVRTVSSYTEIVAGNIVQGEYELLDSVETPPPHYGDPAAPDGPYPADYDRQRILGFHVNVGLPLAVVTWEWERP
jgi:hypothetical protein